MPATRLALVSHTCIFLLFSALFLSLFKSLIIMCFSLCVDVFSCFIGRFPKRKSFEVY